MSPLGYVHKFSLVTAFTLCKKLSACGADAFISDDRCNLCDAIRLVIGRVGGLRSRDVGSIIIRNERFMRRTERALQLAQIAEFVARAQSKQATGAEDAG